MILKRSFRFEAAHQLPEYPGKCRELHGHSYLLTVTLKIPIDPKTGLSMDFEEITAVVERKVVSLVDHRNLNEIVENPTSERVVMWIWEKLERELKGLYEIELAETENSSVVYRGEE